MKPSILYYSDCPFFAGCENMIANFLNAQTIKRDFDISFAYSYSEKYEQGLNSRVSSINYQKYPIKLFKQLYYNNANTSSSIWSAVRKAFFALYILINKYLSIGINTILLFQFLKKHKFDILHINNGGYPAANSCYSAVIAGKLAGINKIIYVVNNIAVDYKHPYRWLDYPLDFFIKKWVTIFITGSEHAGKRLKEVLKLSKSKQITINNGIERRNITKTKEQFKDEYAIRGNKLVASVVANLEKRKGHIFLLEAISLIKEQYPKDLIPYFIFEGIGPEKNNLEEYIAKNDLKEHVLMVDYIPDIFNLLNASDIIILPSIANEDFPNVIIEAMSLGKPVIGTNIAGIPEQIENSKTGIIVPPKSSEELKNAIMKLSTDSSLIQKFSTEAKTKFDQLFEKSISIQKYHNLYNSIL